MRTNPPVFPGTLFSDQCTSGRPTACDSEATAIHRCVDRSLISFAIYHPCCPRRASTGSGSAESKAADSRQQSLPMHHYADGRLGADIHIPAHEEMLAARRQVVLPEAGEPTLIMRVSNRATGMRA